MEMIMKYFAIAYMIVTAIFVILLFFPSIASIVNALKNLIKHTWKPTVLLIICALFLTSEIIHFFVGFEKVLKHVEQNYGISTARTLYGFNAIFSEVVALLFIWQLIDILFPLENKNEEKRTEEQSTIEPPQMDRRKEAQNKVYLELEKVEEK